MSRAVGILAGLLLGGCAGSDGELGIAAVPDSADAELVHTTVAVWESERPWTIDEAPLVSIGAADGDVRYLFGNISGVLVLPGGGIAVADALSAQLRFFDPQGAHIRSVGRAGDGPGEFRALSSLELCGGRLHAFDGRLGRMTVFTVAGELVESYQLSEPGTERRPYQHRCGPGGQFLLAGWGIPPSRGRGVSFSLYAQRAPVWILDASRTNAIPIGTYVSSERVYSVNRQTGGSGSGPHPFGRAVVFSLDSVRVFVGRSERLQVEVRDLGGRLLRILRGPDLDLSVTPSLVQGYLEAEMSRADSILRDRLIENEMRSPPTVPAYQAFLNDPLGNLWVARFDRWSDERRWGVFDPAGRFLGHVSVPPRFALFSIGVDAVYGVSRSDLGVESVEVYRLRREPRDR